MSQPSLKRYDHESNFGGTEQSENSAPHPSPWTQIINVDCALGLLACIHWISGSLDIRWIYKEKYVYPVDIIPWHFKRGAHCAVTGDMGEYDDVMVRNLSWPVGTE